MKSIAFVIVICLQPLSAQGQSLPRAVSDADYGAVRLGEARLGQLLFYDPVLSGNRTVACATCHHPKFGTGDGVSLSLGDGGIGLGPERKVDLNDVPAQRIPRNAPALFNLGAQEFTVLFHDGRLEVDPSQPGGLRTPMDADMVSGFASVLSAQTMFPVLSRDEMAGSYDENNVARAVRQGRITGEGGAWDLLSDRVAAIPVYADLFMSVYPEINAPDEIAFTDISNAIAAFMAFEWRSDTAPFDAVLRGDMQLDGAALAGMTLFYGDAGCAACHSGPFLTDHAFHAMGEPQIGPGKAATFETHQRDEGRYRVTGLADDLFAFRTPSLRNVALTAPYGHAGSYADLLEYLAHHVDPVAGLAHYDPSSAILPAFASPDFTVMTDEVQVSEIAEQIEVAPVPLSVEQLTQLVAFLHTLTDPVAAEGRLGIPSAVPSGLPVP